MVFYNTLPLYGVLMGAAFLDEPLTLAHFIFGGLILAGGFGLPFFAGANVFHITQLGCSLILLATVSLSQPSSSLAM
jgi:hypothetical protein